MRRGEIWTLRDEHYATKARPVVIIQSDLVDEFDSVVVVLLTSHPRESPTRVRVEPIPANGLKVPSYVLVEKLFTVPRGDLGIRVGQLDDGQMRSVSTALARVLGITSADV